MQPRLLRPDDAAEYLGLSKATFRRLADAPGFPKPIYLGQRLPRWDRQALDSYLDAKASNGRTYDDPDEILGGSHESRPAQARRRVG